MRGVSQYPSMDCIYFRKPLQVPSRTYPSESRDALHFGTISRQDVKEFTINTADGEKEVTFYRDKHNTQAAYVEIEGKADTLIPTTVNLPVDNPKIQPTDKNNKLENKVTKFVKEYVQNQIKARPIAPTKEEKEQQLLQQQQKEEKQKELKAQQENIKIEKQERQRELVEQKNALREEQERQKKAARYFFTTALHNITQSGINSNFDPSLDISNKLNETSAPMNLAKNCLNMEALNLIKEQYGECTAMDIVYNHKYQTVLPQMQDALIKSWKQLGGKTAEEKARDKKLFEAVQAAKKEAIQSTFTEILGNFKPNPNFAYQYFQKELEKLRTGETQRALLTKKFTHKSARTDFDEDGDENMQRKLKTEFEAKHGFHTLLDKIEVMPAFSNLSKEHKKEIRNDFHMLGAMSSADFKKYEKKPIPANAYYICQKNIWKDPSPKYLKKLNELQNIDEVLRFISPAETKEHYNISSLRKEQEQYGGVTFLDILNNVKSASDKIQGLNASQRRELNKLFTKHGAKTANQVKGKRKIKQLNIPIAQLIPKSDMKLFQRVKAIIEQQRWFDLATKNDPNRTKRNSVALLKRGLFDTLASKATVFFNDLKKMKKLLLFQQNEELNIANRFLNGENETLQALKNSLIRMNASFTKKLDDSNKVIQEQEKIMQNQKLVLIELIKELQEKTEALISKNDLEIKKYNKK